MTDEPAGIVTVDRETLYREVWSVPGRTLAEKYGVSDVALGKACRRHCIPRSSRGYWAKLAHGKPIAQEPLPPLEDGRLQEVRFYRGVAGTRSFHDPELAAKDVDTAGPRLVVPDRLSSPHPLVDSTRKHFTRSDGRRPEAEHEQQQMLDLNVSPKSLARALRIMDTLIKAWESLGGSVGIDRHRFDQTMWCACFRMGKDSAEVALEERRERIAGSSRWDSQWRHTGRLVLRLDQAFAEGLRRTWADGKRQRLEDILDSVVSGLLEHIDANKRRRLDQEVEERQASRAKARREAAQQREEEQKRLREALEQDADRWRRARHIREYVEAVEAEVAEGRLQPKDEEGFARWLRWAHWYVDHLDPFTQPGPPPEEEQAGPGNLPLSEIELTSYTRPALERLSIRSTDELYELSEEAIGEAVGDRWPARVWDEVCRALEGLGYDTSGRRYWLR